MELQYTEEQIANVSQLMLQLDSVPVGKSHGYPSTGSAAGVVVQLQRKLKKYSSTTNAPDRSRTNVNGMPESGKSHVNSILATRPSIAAASWGEELLGENAPTMSSINHVGTISKLSIQLSFHLEVNIFHR